jgi:protein phosphatase
MAIGANAPLTVNYYCVRLETGAFVLLCSDGLHGVLELSQMEQILARGREGGLEESCSELIAAAKAAGGPDNVTVVLVRKSD